MSSELDRQRQRSAELEAGIRAYQQKGVKEGEVDLAQFDWVKLHQELNTDQATGKPHIETSSDKTQRVFGNNPFIVIGKQASENQRLCNLLRFHRDHF